MDRKDSLSLLQKYEAGLCSQEEKELFDDFCDGQQKLNNKWAEIDKLDQQKICDEMHASIMEKIDRRSRNGEYIKQIGQQSSTVPYFNWRVYVTAACLLFVCGIGSYMALYTNVFNQRQQFIHTGYGQQQTITLSDGSTVWLSAQSTLSYPLTFSEDSRVVTLSGEAFFDVRRDTKAPFIVKTNQLQTTVLGTSFNIQAYPEENQEQVTVVTGKVEVKPNSNHPGVELLPTEQGVYSLVTNILAKKKVHVASYTSWQDNVISLNGNTLEETTEILGRWYDVTFEFEDEIMKNCTLNGQFKNSRFTDLLENIQFLTGINYRITSKNVVILSGNSCNPN